MSGALGYQHAKTLALAEGQTETVLDLFSCDVAVGYDITPLMNLGGRYQLVYQDSDSALLPDLWLAVAAIVAVAFVVVLRRRGEGTGLVWAATAGILVAPYAGTYSALTIAVAMPFLAAVAPWFALAILAISPIATGYALPIYAAAILAGALLLRPDGPALPDGQASPG